MDNTAARSIKAVTSAMNGPYQGTEIPIVGDNATIPEKKREVGDNSSRDDSASRKSSSVSRLNDTEPPAQGQGNAAAKEECFPFLDLPPELRNMIYKIALVSRYGYPAFNATSRRGTPLSRPLKAGIQAFKDRHWICPALLTTCRMIYYEARTLFWAQPFTFTTTVDLYRFLQEIGPRACTLLRDVTIMWLPPAVRKEGDVPGGEGVMRLLEEAEHMKFFRVMALIPSYLSTADMLVVQNFRTALGKSPTLQAAECIAHLKSSAICIQADKVVETVS